MAVLKLDLPLSTSHPILSYTLFIFAPILLLYALVSHYYPLIRTHFRLRSFPRVGIDPGLFYTRISAAKRQFWASGEQIMIDGYAQYRSTPFVVQTANQHRLVVPLDVVEETRNLPESQISHKAALLDRFLGPYTGFNAVKDTSAHRDVCKVQLTQNLDVLMPHMSEEAELYLDGVLGKAGAEGTTVSVGAFEIALQAITHITSRVLLDDVAQCRRKEWLEALVAYPANASAVATALKTPPAFLRPLIYPFLASTKKLKESMRTIGDILDPVIAERKRSAKGDQHLDILRWLMDEEPYATPEHTIGNIIFLVIAAIHTSAFGLTHAMYDLCAMPELQDTLRQEVLEVFGADEKSRVWGIDGIRKLRRMDAFFKESHRVNSPSVLNYNRLVRRDIKLADGTVLPEGSLVCMAGAARSKDPAIYEAAYEFRAERFYVPPGRSKEEESRNMWTSTSAGDSWFGHGPQACPGRWYGEAQIKLVMSMMLASYDLSFPNGQKARPEDLKGDERITPNMAQEVVFRKRQA